MLSILGHKGNGIKMTLSFHLTSVRMTVISDTTNIGKDAGWVGGGLLFTVGGNVN
jgi:hypothetical protein